jgi:hypothetical protein
MQQTTVYLQEGSSGQGEIRVHHIHHKSRPKIANFRSDYTLRTGIILFIMETAKLCSRCSKLFSFADTDSIITRKANFEEILPGLTALPNFEILRNNLEKYRNKVESRTATSLVPCPWNDYAELENNFLE